jgi:hypothetical protein
MPNCKKRKTKRLIIFRLNKQYVKKIRVVFAGKSRKFYRNETEAISISNSKMFVLKIILKKFK